MNAILKPFSRYLIIGTLLWVVLLVLQLEITQFQSRYSVLLGLALVEIMLLMLPMLFLRYYARMHHYQNWTSQEVLFILLGLLLIALAANQLDVVSGVTARSSERAYHALRVGHMLLMNLVLPFVIVCVVILWIRVNWRAKWRPLDVVAAVFSGSLLYLLCIMAAVPHSLSVLRFMVHPAWAVGRCYILPVLPTLVVGCFWITSRDRRPAARL